MNKLAIVGQQLMKGNFGNAFAAISTKSMASELIVPSRFRDGNFFFGINGADKAFVWGNFNSSLIAYQKNPIVAAVINKMAQCHINGKTVVMDLKGKESMTPQALAIKKLMLRPNPLQNGKQFKAQQKIYKGIYGYCPVLIIRPVGFEKDFSRWRLWNLPPWMVQVLDNMKLFYANDGRQFDSIRLTYLGHSVALNPDDVFFLKDNQISTGTYMHNSNQINCSLFLPDSKLYALRDVIDAFNNSLDSRDSTIRNRGPQWLLTNDQSDADGSGLLPTDPKQKDELHKDFLQYGIMTGQRKAIITDAKLKLQTVGFNVAEMQLLEGEIQNAKMICDGLNYPPYLLGLVDAKFDNQQIAERSLYTNSIIPDAESDDEQWAELFGLEALGLKLSTDFSHLPAMQENIAEQGKGRFYMNQALLIEWLQNQITFNRWRELMGEDTVPGMDLYYYQCLQKPGWVAGVVPNTPMPVDTPHANNNSSSSSSNNNS